MTDPTLARIEALLEEIRDALASGRESRQVAQAEPTADDHGEYPALRCGVYGSPAAARWDDCETRDPNQCEPGCVRPSLHDGDCVLAWPGTATIDDRHQWAMSDEEAQRILRAGQELGFVAEADPLDEDDHRPRHFADGMHLTWRETCRHWHTEMSLGRCYGTADARRLSWWQQGELPLTFCDCDDATTEAENGATD